MCELGWKSIGVLELTALTSIDKENWLPQVQEVDALLVGGGDPMYLCEWMRESGFADLLPSLRPETVYVGLSAESMAVTPHFGETYDCRERPVIRGVGVWSTSRSARTLRAHKKNRACLPGPVIALQVNGSDLEPLPTNRLPDRTLDLDMSDETFGRRLPAFPLAGTF
jgi:hypothetical protein